MRCCDRECTTPFCPHCGAPVGSPLVSLLAYCRVQESAAAQRLARRKADDPGHRRVPAVQRVARKWESWVKALEQVIRDPDVPAVRVSGKLDP